MTSDRTDTAPFVKRRADAPVGFFAVEAAGLAWLADSGPGAAAVVKVLEVGHRHIALEPLQTVRPSAAAAEAFGRGLAVTHAAGAAAFGQPPDGWLGGGFIGRQSLSLRPGATWGRFYAEQRVLPYARQARDLGHLNSSDARAVDLVAERLAAGEFDDGRPPARIHGDLWAGNVLFTAAGVVLIDCAAHGGHRLTDLAMLDLFGAPHLDRILAAYAEAAERPAGCRTLIGLHQLHPLLVHAVSHGPTYGTAAGQVARSC